MIEKKMSCLFVSLLFVGSTYLLFADQTLSEKKEEKKENKYIQLWIGYNQYKMAEFSNKLRLENNEPINNGIDVGLEINAVEFTVLGLKIGAPIGVEYLGAESKTEHAYSGGTVTVDWKLPVCGLYIAPELSIKNVGGLYLRPLGVGYYTLGKIFQSRLIVTDRPGRLEASSNTFGIFGSIGMKYSVDTVDIFAEAGYRWIDFSNIFLDPKDGFTESTNGPLVQPGYSKEAIDYSGFIIKIGIKFKINP
jgi:hypothetical protein